MFSAIQVLCVVIIAVGVQVVIVIKWVPNLRGKSFGTLGIPASLWFAMYYTSNNWDDLPLPSVEAQVCNILFKKNFFPHKHLLREVGSGVPGSDEQLLGKTKLRVMQIQWREGISVADSHPLATQPDPSCSELFARRISACCVAGREPWHLGLLVPKSGNREDGLGFSQKSPLVPKTLLTFARGHSQ